MSADAPADLSPGGARLWRSLLAQDASLTDEMNPTRELALEACRTKDRCDFLDAIVRSEPPMVDNGKGLPIAHPAWVEARQQGNVLKQLVVALRLPDDATGKRPQRRTGSSPIRSQSASPVSSLEMARSARG